MVKFFMKIFSRFMCSWTSYETDHLFLILQLHLDSYIDDLTDEVRHHLLKLVLVNG